MDTKKIYYWVVIQWNEPYPSSDSYAQGVMSTTEENPDKVIEMFFEQYYEEFSFPREQVFYYTPHIFQHGERGVEIKKENGYYELWADGKCAERLKTIDEDALGL